MPDYATHAHGAAVFPLTTSTANSLLKDADPAIFHALNFFEGMLNIHLRPRLHAQGLIHGLRFDAIAPTKIPVEPYPHIQSGKFRFPILSLYRKEESQDEHTTVFEKSTSEWELAFVLPFLTDVQSEALAPSLRAVTRIVARACRCGFDPNYNSGELVWQTAKLVSVWMVRARYAVYEHIERVSDVYRCVVITLRVQEIDEVVESAREDFAGADINVDLREESTSTTLADVVKAKTDVG